MNRELLTLYGLKFNPFTTELPVEALMPTPAVDSFCRRVEQIAIVRFCAWTNSRYN